MTNSKVLLVGVATREASKRRTIEIASGKRTRAPDEPRVWFTSLGSLAKVLSESNMLLLETIRDARPHSVAELAELSGRKKTNLSRTLKHMAKIGLVDLEALPGGRKQPRVNYDKIRLVGAEFALGGKQAKAA
jgi:predicted transcriptional regulator